MSLEDLAIRVVTLYGTTADYSEIYDVLNSEGLHDPDGELARRVKEIASTAVVRVRVRYA